MFIIVLVLGFLFLVSTKRELCKKTYFSQKISILEVVNLTVVILTPQHSFIGDHIRVFQIGRRTSKNCPTKITFKLNSFFTAVKFKAMIKKSLF